jgi:hypothetical protein
LISWFRFFARCPVTELKGADLTHPFLGTAKRPPQGTPSRAVRRVLDLVLWQKFAVLETDRSQSYANLVLGYILYICFELTVCFYALRRNFPRIKLRSDFAEQAETAIPSEFIG